MVCVHVDAHAHIALTHDRRARWPMARARCAALELLANAFARLDDEPRARLAAACKCPDERCDALRARLVEARYADDGA